MNKSNFKLSFCSFLLDHIKYYSHHYVSSSVPQERIENLIKSTDPPFVNLASKVKEEN